MVDIYSAPSDLEPPTFVGIGYEEYESKCEEYEQEIVNICKKQSSFCDAGVIIYFPVADGKARYVVYNLSTLVHISTGDAYQIPDAHARGLTASCIEKEIKKTKAFSSLFKRNKDSYSITSKDKRSLLCQKRN
jgi:hypothetical protein